jgi:hypothetical protein
MRRTWINFQSWLRSIFSKSEDSGIVEVEGGGSYAAVDMLTLQKMLQERPETFMLVNVHIPFDGNILGTDLSIHTTRMRRIWMNSPMINTPKLCFIV